MRSAPAQMAAPSPGVLRRLRSLGAALAPPAARTVVVRGVHASAGAGLLPTPVAHWPWTLTPFGRREVYSIRDSPYKTY